ncbi:hypothetical protein [Candidatus Amarolinea dominans]|uniref:hypothetical protein n=1 Tax=Candidatus Amarolinea dominans TaxID=3140696 RepID=UPI003134ECCC|nr:hypothetical protein [Anaerolineae bacterium]
MNDLLVQYATDVEFPDVSGAEHLEMLLLRDRLADLQPTLTAVEKQTLAAADECLLGQVAAFYRELSRFVDLAQRRQTTPTPPQHWWWYLDVLAQLPVLSPLAASPTTPDQPTSFIAAHPAPARRRSIRAVANR